MAEEWCTHKIVVKSGERLPRIDITELHERRFILWLEHKWDTKVKLGRVIPHINTSLFDQEEPTLGM